jgi:hypothetical protein
LGLPNNFPLNLIDYLFGNVGGVIGQTLYVAGDQQQID